MSKQIHTIIKSLLLLFAATALLSSCSKNSTRKLNGEYHYRLGGTVTTQTTDGANSTQEIIVEYQYGTMKIISTDSRNNTLYISMSSALRGAFSNFTATEKDGIITFTDAEIQVNTHLPGETSSSAVSKNTTKLCVDGVGKRYGDELLFDFTAKGTITTKIPDPDTYTDVITDLKVIGSSIKCEASKNE